ncbi:MAG: alkaline phosphatase family protein [Halobacteriales archaeon]|nr:alkaline phosphatase family protein [Halobacteriales archaeon]
MTRTSVFLIVDAGRQDYVRPDSMPFLHGLAQQSLTGSMVSPPGFAQRTAFFTGVHPDVSNNLSAYVYDPENSPFRWLRKLGPLPNVVKPYKAFVPARRAIKHITKWVSDSYHTDPAWIPPRYAPFFRLCEDSKPVHDPGALGRTSIFDLCREHGLTYTYRAHPVSGDDDKIHASLVRDLSAGKDYRLYVAQFSIMDQQGHKHGPFADYIQNDCLAELDRKIKEVHGALQDGYSDFDLFVCADHGMAPVEQRVDIQKALRKLPLTPAKDYVVFVNSTLAVLWYQNERARREIEAALPSIPGGRPISDEERRKRRIPTSRQWGDRMFAAHPGTLFWPDYFHVKDSVIKGMHGYLDKTAEQYGMAVLTRSEGIAPGGFEPRSLVDVFPTLCDLLGVPVPEGQEGTSLLAKEPHAARKLVTA